MEILRLVYIPAASCESVSEIAHPSMNKFVSSVVSTSVYGNVIAGTMFSEVTITINRSP